MSSVLNSPDSAVARNSLLTCRPFAVNLLLKHYPAGAKMRKRRKYLINRNIQLRYMGMVSVLIAIMCITSVWTAYVTMWSSYSELVGDHPMLYATFAEMNRTLLLRFSAVLAAGMFLSVLITLFISHRIAGPMYRLEKILGEIAGGKMPRAANLRKKDEFKELASAINSAIGRLEKITDENRQIISRLNRLLEEGADKSEIQAELLKMVFLEEEASA